MVGFNSPSPRGSVFFCSLEICGGNGICKSLVLKPEGKPNITPEVSPKIYQNEFGWHPYLILWMKPIKLLPFAMLQKFGWDGLIAANRSVAACLHLARTITGKDGPLPPLANITTCCGAARHCGHSLQLQNLRRPDSQNADKVALNPVAFKDRFRHFFIIERIYDATLRASTTASRTSQSKWPERDLTRSISRKAR